VTNPFNHVRAVLRACFVGLTMLGLQSSSHRFSACAQFLFTSDHHERVMKEIRRFLLAS
jgi:hypothetical protein